MDYKKLLNNVKEEEAKDALTTINGIRMIDNKYKNAYFWTPGRIASCRRAREFEEEFEFVLNGNKFVYSCSYSESCRNCYFNKSVYCNDKAITMRTINTLEKKLKAIFSF